MSLIVGRDYAYVECNHPACDEKTEKVYGDKCQRVAYNKALEEGWYRTLTGRWFCPSHR